MPGGGRGRCSVRCGASRAARSEPRPMAMPAAWAPSARCRLMRWASTVPPVMDEISRGSRSCFAQEGRAQVHVIQGNLGQGVVDKAVALQASGELGKVHVLLQVDCQVLRFALFQHPAPVTFHQVACCTRISLCSQNCVQGARHAGTEAAARASYQGCCRMSNGLTRQGT